MLALQYMPEFLWIFFVECAFKHKSSVRLAEGNPQLLKSRAGSNTDHSGASEDV